MARTEPSNDPLDTRRRRARFRAWHRGTREMDLILGRFADAHVTTMSDRDLDDFEALMTVPDTDLYRWIAGGEPAAEGFDRPVLRAIVRFHATVRRAEQGA